VLVLSVIVAALAGVSLSFAAGARRTATAPDRYEAVAGQGFDAMVSQGEGPTRIEEIAALAAVEAVESTTFAFMAVAPQGTTDFFDALAFAGSSVPSGALIVDGRAPDPSNHDEFMATQGLVDQFHLSLGDRFHVGTLTPEQRASDGYGVTELLGPSWTATLVGVIDGPTELNDDQAIMVFSQMTIDDPRIAYAASNMWVALTRGADMDALRSQLNALPHSEDLSLDTGFLISSATRDAVDVQARGLWVLCAVSAIAAVVVLGQLISRHARVSSADRQHLLAVGFTNGQVLAESMGRAAVPIVAGSFTGVGLAITLSGLFPTGFVNVIEPSPGLRTDATVMTVGALAFTFVLAVWIATVLLMTTRAPRSMHPSGTIEALATRAPSTAAATGLRFAFARRANDRGSVKGALAGLVLTVAGLIGAITFGLSVDRLVDEPARYGSNFDIALDDGAERVTDEVRTALAQDPDVEAVMLMATIQARIGQESIYVLGMEPIRGSLVPAVLEGRLPTGEDEIALGRTSAREIGARVGDTVQAQLADASVDFRVTGIVVVPGLGANEGIGTGGVATIGGVRRLSPDTVANTALVRVRDEADPETRRRIAATAGLEGPEPAFQPAAITNVARIRSIPFVLAGVLGVLLILTVTHVMLTSIRNGRRDLAVLRTIGADGRWITRTIHWQVTAFAVLPIMVGSAVGIVAGRLVFEALADDIGASSQSVVPSAMVAVVATAIVVCSNATAAIPARRVRVSATARALQSE
jgi:ABC-type lipoprotein release transport system permease subunit